MLIEIVIVIMGPVPIPSMIVIQLVSCLISAPESHVKVGIKPKYNTVKEVIFARSYFRDLPIFNCFACF